MKIFRQQCGKAWDGRRIYLNSNRSKRLITSLLETGKPIQNSPPKRDVLLDTDNGEGGSKATSLGISI